MLWPLVLPFQITSGLMMALIVVLTIAAPRWKWKRTTAFPVLLTLACILFVPSCRGIMTIVDLQRFGVFHYDTDCCVNAEKRGATGG